MEYFVHSIQNTLFFHSFYDFRVGKLGKVKGDRDISILDSRNNEVSLLIECKSSQNLVLMPIKADEIVQKYRSSYNKMIKNKNKRRTQDWGYVGQVIIIRWQFLTMIVGFVEFSFLVVGIDRTR